MTLEEQILQRWGRYGDWNSAGQNQASDLARLFAANGINSLDGANISRFGYSTPNNEFTDEGATWTTPGFTGDGYRLSVGGKDFSFLGDINQDGSLAKLGINNGMSFDAGDPGEYLGADGKALDVSGLLGGRHIPKGSESQLGAWSARGGGHTNFTFGTDPTTGENYLAPVWESSSAGDRKAGLTAAAILAAAFGGQALLGAGAPTGAGGIAGGSGLTVGGSAGYGSMLGSGLGGTGAGLSITPAMTAAFTTPQLAAMGAAGSVLGSGGLGSPSTLGLDVSSLSPIEFPPLTADTLTGGLTTGEAAAGAQAGLSSADKAAMFGNTGYGAPMSGLQTSAFDTVAGLTGSNTLGAAAANLAGSPLVSGANSLLSGAKDVLGATGLNAGSLLGAAAGALSSKDQTQTTSRDPWGAAQPFLKDLLAQGQTLSQKYTQQPFSQAQQTAYGNVGSLLDTINANSKGLLAPFSANASGANQFVRGQPQKLQGGGMNFNFNPGLLGYMGTR